MVRSRALCSGVASALRAFSGAVCWRAAMPLSPQTLGRRLRCILRKFHQSFDPDAHVYPDTSAALGRSEAALDAEMPPWAPRKRGRGKTDRAGQARAVPSKVTYLRRVVQNLRALLKHVRAQQGHRVASAFVCKVACRRLSRMQPPFPRHSVVLSVMGSVLGER